MCSIELKERSIDLKILWVEYPVRVISVAVVIYSFLCFKYIEQLISVNCNKELWCLSPDKLSGYIETQVQSTLSLRTPRYNGHHDYTDKNTGQK